MKDSMWLKKSQSLLSVVAINLVLTFLCLEAVSLAYYFITQKKFFYTRSAGQELALEEIGQANVRLDASIAERLHPFFGYVLKQGAFTNEKLGLKVNQQGFFSLYDYPLLKTNKNQYIIGIFGGSVANNFAVDEYVTQRFSKKLKASPEFANKEIYLLNFGNGGYKQPQQLLILNYMLALGQELDMVINIDGFNEVALSNLNNQSQIDVTMPSVQHIQPLSSLANSNFAPELMSYIVKVQETKKQLKQAIAQEENCQLALCYTWRSLRVKQLVRQYQDEVIRYDQQRTKQRPGSNNEDDNIVYIAKPNAALDKTAVFERIAATWYESSITMNQILSSRKIRYFHFIQPNQYYPTNRVFTEDEKRIAISKDSPYAEGVKQGYPVLLSKLESLRKANVNAFSGVNILDNAQETVYKDGCCHYNSVGEEILAEFMANSILTTIRTSK